MTSAIMSLDGRAVVWEPLPKQRLAMACPADEVLYGGTKGCAKTDALIMRPAPLLQAAHEEYRCTGRLQRCLIVIFRKTLSNEARDMIQRTKDLYPLLDPQMGSAGWAETQHRWQFTSGAQVIFAHLDGPDDHRRWNGVELAGIGIDQVEEISFDVYKFLVANNRTTNLALNAEKFVFVTANPGGKHADWVYEYFVEPAPEGSVLLRETMKVKGGTEEREYTRAFIKATLKDNPYYYNDGEYEAKLRSMPKNQQRWYLDGDWTGSIDGYFSGLLDPEIHFIDSFDVPPAWDIGAGMDWGEKSPAAWELAVKDSDNRIYFIDELYEPGVTGKIFGARILEKVRQQKWSTGRIWRPDEIHIAIDPSASWERSARGKMDTVSIPAAIASYGFPVSPGVNDRVTGWRQMSERMVKDETGKPQIYVCRDKCPQLCKQLQRLMPDPRNPADIDTKMEDHAADAARYRSMEWPLSHYRQRDEEDEIERWMRVQQGAPSYEGAMSTGYGD